MVIIYKDVLLKILLESFQGVVGTECYDDVAFLELRHTIDEVSLSSAHHSAKSR